ncbi:aldo/keto reductase [Methylobrevis albus]|uniref:Aldo/keto reductase n=1 Tax=Methylobrevis albus TaxID=2793297 RepID=A0A931I092_9HYPH|nr:aldo/keto reductase [Methylobrevis albus]MBH0237750.1 aldo/keto reductase [Methylobrevis albus]
MTDQPHVAFSDGHEIPQVGLGVWQTPNDQAASVVATALEAGYRHIDTAAIYGNEAGVGEGLQRAGLARGDVFVTTKLWNDRQGADEPAKAMDESLKRLGLDHVDLYLIHWPAPKAGRFVDSWKALVQLQVDGRATSIGVSNFNADHLRTIIDATGVVPVLNQVELHPRFQQTALRAAHAELGIATQSWSPLGQGQLLTDPVITKIAAKHGRTAAQVVIRWHIDSGLIVIPKSVTPSRIKENFDVFGFELDADDMAAIAGLDTAGGRIGPDPLKFP